jgi:ribosomal protein S18 acetylase RimI-like enzyme
MLGRVSLTTRPLRYVDGVVDPDDLALATRFVLECEAAVIEQPDTTADEVVRMLSVSSVDRAASAFLLDGDDAAGLVVIEKDPYEGVTGIDAFSLPWPGTADVRAEALRLGLEAARAHAAEAGSSTWRARTGGYIQDSAFSDVMTGAGFAPVRRFYRMSIDASSPLIPPVAPALPDDVEILTGDDRSTWSTIYDVDRAAFAEHWGFAEYPYDDWIEHMTASPSFDPADWWLVTVGGVPAAICLLSEQRASLGEGYVGVLGVLKEFRGRGLAQMLLQRSFVLYRDRGRTAIALGVDATNTTGAVALYEKVGMHAALVMEAYERGLS